MNAPLPEVPPYVAKKRDFAKAPLPSLSVVCAIEAITSVSLPLLSPQSPDMSQFWHRTLVGIVIALGLLHIYYLWRGYRLARTLWLWFSVLALPFYFSDPEMFKGSQAKQFLSYFDLAFSLFMLVWLNLPGVKAHFAQRKTVELN